MIVVSLIDGRNPLAASQIETSAMRLYFGRAIVALGLLLVTVGSAPAQDGAAATLASTGELRVAIQTWNPVLASAVWMGSLAVCRSTWPTRLPQN